MSSTDTAAAVVVRPLTHTDYPGWWPLWEGYLHFYQHPLSEQVTLLTFERLCIGERLAGLVAEAPDGTLLGLAHLVFHPSSWSEHGYCYLEDLYVSEAARGQGIAHRLFDAVYQLADEKQCDRVYWATHETNTRARALYDQLGERTAFLTYRRW
ncbi:N-acetyltransferase [Chimaeribacter arupi]|uniref:N-acetyltransferase n=2 Tax=Yersiniaceae TaxID=1903411 RepID=A0A2N5EJI7_9GAMM|nr:MULTISPECIES: GNAT family N-acetyltransferase [Yersiniaceae]MBS0967659.1 GNAT family N-acetyltransferase [Nissabacter archeti]MDV5140878.1 GNAT family N-acetyltransferase [Chimaeribacter arupi]PLR39059.1 N-acetyltransferase [Chimaeribacter arupi]PLR42022.1 N-acetyltransferase [Chimaeribacter arupi]PLR45705.1 N-acetyltransferase [Chimaeribacter arupi]